MGSTQIHLLSAAALVRVMLWHSGNCGDGLAPSLSEVGPLSDVMANATGWTLEGRFQRLCGP